MSISNRLRSKKINCNVAFFDLVMILVILVGFSVRIYQYFCSRSLWLDEAMLANSILTRGFFDLCASALDFSQSAPIGYLYIVKIFTLILGSNESVLRSPSLIASIGIGVILYKISKDILVVKKPLIGVAMISIIPTYIYYSNELKPYMLDVCFVLLVIYLYGMFQNKKINYMSLTIIYAVIIWFSFPTIFFIGSIMVLELISFIMKLKDYKSSMKFVSMYLVKSSIVAISLLINYFIWINPSTKSITPVSYDYWKWLSFPLIPRSISDLKLICSMILQMVSPLGIAGILFCLPLFLIGLYNMIKSKQKIIYVIILAFIFILIASYLGKYPIQDRLVLFITALIILVTAVGIDKLETIQPVSVVNKLIAWIVILVFFITQIGFLSQFNAKNVYINGAEVNNLIPFVKNIINDDDKLYIFAYSVPVYCYKTNYETYFHDYLIQPVEKGNIIFGSPYLVSAIKKPYRYNFIIDEDNLNNNVKKIESNNSVYILTSQIKDPEEVTLKRLLSDLKKTGNIEIIKSDYQTYLFHYTKNKTN